MQTLGCGEQSSLRVGSCRATKERYGDGTLNQGSVNLKDMWQHGQRDRTYRSEPRAVARPRSPCLRAELRFSSLENVLWVGHFVDTRAE